MYYSKFEQEPSAFIEELTEWSLRELKNKGKIPFGDSQNWSRSLLPGAVAYESFSLQSLSDKSNGISQCRS